MPSVFEAIRYDVEQPGRDPITWFDYLIWQYLVQNHFDTGDFPEVWANRHALGHLSPAIDWLTRPRSVADFLAAKDELLNNLEDATQANPWLLNMLTLFGWAPNEINAYLRVYPKWEFGLAEYLTSTEDLLKIHPGLKELPSKITAYQELGGILEGLRKSNEIGVRVAVVCGKWRAGCHEEHLETIEMAKRLLGTWGVLVVLMAPRDWILQTEGETTYCEDDKVRLRKLAALAATDLVVLAEPTLETTNEWYDQAWQAVRPDFVVIGSEDDPMVPMFTERCQKYGGLLLWAREKNLINTSDWVEELRGGNYR